MPTNSSGFYHNLQPEVNSSIDKTSRSQGVVNLLTLCVLHMYMHVLCVCVCVCMCVCVCERERAQERHMIHCMSVSITFLENEVPLYLT